MTLKKVFATNLSQTLLFHSENVKKIRKVDRQTSSLKSNEINCKPIKESDR